jgi:predicted membrane metal-binding protein
MAKDNIDTILTVPSIAGFLLVFQLIYWFTLFEAISFYITLIIETLFDIKEFFFILACSLASFSNASIIVEHNYALLLKFNTQQQDSGP